MYVYNLRHCSTNAYLCSSLIHQLRAAESGECNKDSDTKAFRLKGKQYGGAQENIFSPDNKCTTDHHFTAVHPDSSGMHSPREDNKS